MSLHINNQKEKLMSINNEEVAQTMADRSLRIAKIIWIAAAGPDGPSEAFQDLLNDHANDELHAMFGGRVTTQDLEPWEDENIDAEEFLYLLARRKLGGFLAELETPVRRYNREGTSATMSWGFHHSRWIYGDTLDEVVRLGLAWVEEQSEADKKRID